MEWLDKYKSYVPTRRFFLEGNTISVLPSSYYISYPEFIKYFRDITKIDKHNLIIGINFTYGWMPTILDLLTNEYEKALEILNNAKQGSINKDELTVLKELFNNSLVGTSKLLHFIRPDVFAIWDSRVYRYLTGTEPHDYRISDINAYLDYLKFCDYLSKQEGYDKVHNSIEEKIGYPMKPLRTVELIMYTKGEKPKTPKEPFLKDNTDFGIMEQGVV